MNNFLSTNIHYLASSPSAQVCKHTNIEVYGREFGERWRLSAVAWKKPAHGQVWWR